MENCGFRELRAVNTFSNLKESSILEKKHGTILTLLIICIGRHATVHL